MEYYNFKKWVLAFAFSPQLIKQSMSHGRISMQVPFKNSHPNGIRQGPLGYFWKPGSEPTFLPGLKTGKQYLNEEAPGIDWLKKRGDTYTKEKNCG